MCIKVAKLSHSDFSTSFFLRIEVLILIFVGSLQPLSPEKSLSFVTMNQKKFNAALIDLAEKRIQLNQLDYADEKYDEAEDDLHNAEDAFLSEFGDYLENVLDDVHERVCSGTDVLIPTAYIAKNYVRKGETLEGDPLYEITSKEGVIVEADQYPNKTTRLVLVPAPARLILTVNGKAKEIVWELGKN